MSDETWVLSLGVNTDDYQVLCALPSKEAATALAARLNLDNNDRYWHWRDVTVESLPLVDADVQPVTVLYMDVTILDDDTEQEPHELIETRWPFGYPGDPGPMNWRWIRAPAHNGKGGRLEVHGTDQEQVREVFEERRALIHTEPMFRTIREVRSR